jgi:predicted LPLAT superfamily acyltransferase
VLLALIVGYFLAFAPLARRASRDYLARALGRPARWRDVARHLFTFAATIHDRIYLLNGRFDLFDIRVEGTADITAALADGRGAFLMGAHCGSFEVVRAIGRRQARGQTAQRQRDDGIPPMRVAITMFDEHAQQLQAVLAAVNPEVRQDIVALGTPDAMLKVREYLDRNFLVGMLADRSLPRKDGASAAERDMWRTPFLGAPANFPTGPMRMAAMLRRPVIFMTGLYRGGNRYDIRFETIADFSVTPAGQREAALRAAQSRYVALLESRCRAAPHNWFNFYDFWRETDVSAPPR